ncbi:hypothetical protein NPIL_475981 [Nephila pilipes]|uniref:Uncharacterized protein n=1 Tax=Nephila pilipes TaxID=299642 RepID=A0A8X6TBM1_NEPPI|nr:hypothetical protein NPIL_475981 [Nephila pilipes]
MGSVMDVDKQRIQTVLTLRKLDNIKISLRQTSGKSIRKLQLEQEISYGSAYQGVTHHSKFTHFVYSPCRNCVQVIKENDCIFMFGFADLFERTFKSLMMFTSQMKLGSTTMAI